jgi:microcystin-dependent protein
MPSTFSPNLRIELIGNGEQAGNWGSTTNTNLGTLIEQAISGYVTVSVTTANQAFTYADGVSDQARNAMIELTTTTGAAFAVYAPPSPKSYIIFNSSAYAATVYNSTVVGNTTAAGTGVVVPAGKTLTMFTDGTDFKGVATSEFLGVLAAANGGTGLSAPGTSGNVLTSNGTGWTSGTPQPPVPTGAVFYFAANAAPTGYLEADGTAVSRATYAALFAVTGTTFGVGDGSTTFNLPDLRAEFIRGWDDGRGVDTGRVFGSTQADELEAHKHDIRVRGAVSSHSHRIDGPAETYVAAGSSTSLGGSGSIYNDSGAILNTGGTETRPRNVALLACIKT